LKLLHPIARIEQGKTYAIRILKNRRFVLRTSSRKSHCGAEKGRVWSPHDDRREGYDVDFPKYVILGACNPPFAYQALQAEEEIGLLLPCNVIVYEKNGKTTVSIFDPMTMGAVIDNPKMVPIAQQVREKLQRVFASI
jgi:hypothetical protein